MKFTNSQIYISILDLHKFLGLSPHDIEIDPTWPFQVGYQGEEKPFTVLEINTHKGEHCIGPVIALGTFFVGMKKVAEEVAGKELRTVFIKKTIPMNKEVSADLKYAAELAELKVVGIETMSPIHVDESTLNL